MTVGKASALALGLTGAFALGAWVGPDAWRGPVVDGPVSVAVAAELESSAESVQRHARDLLSYGTDVKAAATGFKNAEQFMTVAYAAKNTAIPFVLLKHRVLTEGKSLADAIRELKPGIDATLEANRAMLEARSRLSRLS